jgi:holin-like protein
MGELIVFLTGVKLPSSIIGMLLLTLLLKLGWIKLQWVQGMSDFLVANLGFFFVPPGVAIMLYFDIITAQFWPIVIATLISTILVLLVTGWVHQLTRKIK